MLFTRSNQLARLFNGCGDAAQVGDAGRDVHAVQHLRDTDFVGATNLAAPEIARRQGGFQAHVHDGGFDDFIDVVDVDDFGPITRRLPGTAVDFLGQCGLHVLDHAIVVGLAKQIRQKETRDVYALVGVGIAVIRGNALGNGPQHFAAHVGQEARLLIIHLVSTDLRKQLLGENVLYVALFLGFDGPGIGMFAEPGEGLFAGTNGAGFQNRLQDDGVVRLLGARSKNQLADVAVRENVQGAEQDADGDVGLDTWNRHANHRNQLIFRMVDDLDRIGFRNLVIVGTDALDFHHFHLLGRGAAVAEDEGTILRHALHGNHCTLAALNDKVSADVFGALA